jgi:RNA polymerase sigma-70 factor (ECF subfamily)
VTGAGDAVARLVREERARVLATLIRVTGSVDLAEDATQDAVVRALETWPRDGVPDNPRAWLLVTAKRQAIDHIRREGRRADKETAAMGLFEPADEPAEVVRDDLLRLVFTCCHPFLSLDAQVALALRTLAGMPAAEELPDRLDGVAGTVYLIFNEGYAGRSELAAEAMRLGRVLAELMPDEPTVLGLLALMLLQESRRAARTDADNAPVLLADQDRSRWDFAAIKEGVELVGVALRRSADTPNRYAVQAAIAACHALAPSYDETNWDAVVSWYDVLLTVQDTPVVHLNRAVAVGERDGAAAGLALVNGIDGLDEYPWWHASRAELLNRLGDKDSARTAYERALAAGMTEPTARHLRRRLGDLG